jgi:hypothetical protein
MTKMIRNLMMALVVTAGAVGAMAGPALADDWGRDRDGRAQDWRHTERREPRGYVAYPAPYAYAHAAPAYGYYPAYRYAAPPVAAYAPPAAFFSLMIPLR